MLESFVSRREVRELLRSGPAGSYFEGFAEYLASSSYRRETGRILLYAAWHFTHWAAYEGVAVTALDERALEGFQQHLSSCRCEGPIGSRAKRGNGSALFLRYLRISGVVSEQERVFGRNRNTC